MSAHREPCVPSVVFLQENNGLVLVKCPIVAVPEEFEHRAALRAVGRDNRTSGR